MESIARLEWKTKCVIGNLDHMIWHGALLEQPLRMTYKFSGFHEMEESENEYLFQCAADEIVPNPEGMRVHRKESA